MNDQRFMFTGLLLAGILIVSHFCFSPNDLNQSAVYTDADADADAEYSANKVFQSTSKQYRKKQEFATNCSAGLIKPYHAPGNPSTQKFVRDDPVIQIGLIESRPVEESLPTLNKLLQHENPAIRLAAIEALSIINHRHIPNLLIPELSNRDPMIRVRILNALVNYDDESIIAAIEPYLYDANKQVRLAAIETLSEYEHPQSIAALAGLLADGDTDIRHQAVVAMGEIEDVQVTQYLEVLAYETNENIRVNAKSIIAENENRF